jgi:hypothetical protein
MRKENDKLNLAILIFYYRNTGFHPLAIHG